MHLHPPARLHRSRNQPLNGHWLLQRWACFFGHYWWQRFPLPTFLGEYLYDSANLGDTNSLSTLQ